MDVEMEEKQGIAHFYMDKMLATCGLTTCGGATCSLIARLGYVVSQVPNG